MRISHNWISLSNSENQPKRFNTEEPTFLQLILHAMRDDGLPDCAGRDFDRAERPVSFILFAIDAAVFTMTPGLVTFHGI